MTTYVVQPGDSLSIISKRFFGDFSKVKDLQELNKIPNADIIQPGQKLILPDGVSTVEEAVEVDGDGNDKSRYGRWVGLGFVLLAAFLLGREAMKQKKANKAAAPKKTAAKLNGKSKRK
jgi:LysM repeat protein